MGRQSLQNYKKMCEMGLYYAFLTGVFGESLVLFAKMEQTIYGGEFRGDDHGMEKRFSFGWGRRTVR